MITTDVSSHVLVAGGQYVNVFDYFDFSTVNFRR